MERISVNHPDEQREWIDHVALEIDGSRSDVVRRAIATYRQEWAETDDTPEEGDEDESQEESDDETIGWR